LPYNEIADKLERSAAYAESLNNPQQAGADIQLEALTELEREKKRVV
jgi:hypothetical protein